MSRFAPITGIRKRLHDLLRRVARTLLPPRRRTPRRARVVLIWTLLVFAVLHVGLLLVVQRSPELRDPLFEERANLLRGHIAAAGTTTPKIVVMIGTSRTGNAFDADRIQRGLRADLDRPVVTFNCGIAAMGPVMQQIYLRRLLAKGIKPDLVILEVLPIWFVDDAGKPTESPLIDANRINRDEIDLLEKYHVPIEPFEKRWREIRLNPWGEMRNHLIRKVRPTWLPANATLKWNEGIDAWGWRGLKLETEVAATYAIFNDIARKEHAPCLAQFRLGQPALQALSDTLNLCRKEGITAIVVHLPEDANFRSWYPPATRSFLEDTFAKAASEHGGIWIDAKEWVPDGNFYDGHHLLERGAAIFSDRLNSDYLRPMLLSRP